MPTLQLKSSATKRINLISIKQQNLEIKIVQIKREISESKDSKFSWNSIGLQADQIFKLISENDPQVLKQAYSALFDRVVVEDEDEMGIRKINYILNDSFEDLGGPRSEMVVLGDTTANHKTDPLILTTYLVLRHPFRFKRNIEQLYNGKGLSAREIATKLGSSHHAINEAIKRFALPKPNKIRRPKYGRPSPSKSEAQHIYESKVVETIKILRAKGISYRAICTHLKEKNLKNFKKGNTWSHSTVRRICKVR